MTLPYEDNLMFYDYENHRYVLTEKDVENMGIDLKTRVSNANIRQGLLKDISFQVYSFIHQYSTNDTYQDYIIAKTQKGREIIKSAMEQQLRFYLYVGDRSVAVDREEREAWFSPKAENELLKTIPEIGTSILYCGAYIFYGSQDKSPW